MIDRLKFIKMLSNKDITTFLTCRGTGGMIRGVYAADKIPEDLGVGDGPAVIIINTATSSTMGEHWIAVYIRRKWMYFFDSFGRPPESFKGYISNFASKYAVIPNLVQFQDPSSDVCGFYCVYFAMRTADEGRPYQAIGELHNLKKKDDQVKDYVNKSFSRLFNSFVLLFVIILSLSFLGGIVFVFQKLFFLVDEGFNIKRYIDLFSLAVLVGCKIAMMVSAMKFESGKNHALHDDKMDVD